MNKLFALIPAIVACGSLQAITVLPPATSFNSELGNSIRQGLNDGMQQGFAQGAQRRAAQEAARYEQAMRERERLQCSHILQGILQDYQPERTPEYVVKVLQSELSSETKDFVITQLNGIYDCYLKQQATKKG